MPCQVLRRRPAARRPASSSRPRGPSPNTVCVARACRDGRPCNSFATLRTAGSRRPLRDQVGHRFTRPGERLTRAARASRVPDFRTFSQAPSFSSAQRDVLLGPSDRHTSLQRSWREPRRPPASPDSPMLTARLRRKPPHTCPLHRTALQQGPQLIVCSKPQIEQSWTVETGSGQPRRVLGTRSRGKVPGADILADVAAVRVLANRASRAPPESSPSARSSGMTDSVSNRGRGRRRGRRSGTHPGTAGAHAALIELPGHRASSSRLQMISARNIHEPSSGLMRQVFLPIQPSPACCGVDTLLNGPGVHVCARFETGRRLASRSHSSSPSSRRLDHRRDNRRPRRSGRWRA